MNLDALAPFEARRIVERLRSGVFDPIAAVHLTAGEERLSEALHRALTTDSHLCVSGAFGDGKSHALHVLRRLADQRNYATSLVTLDPREVPFHRPRLIYRALLGALRLPGEPTALHRGWRAFASTLDVPDEVLPARLPRPFRQVLSALARQTVSLDRAQRAQRQHRNYRPQLIASTLKRALAGDPVGAPRVRAALRYRDVPDRKGKVGWSGTETTIEALAGIAELVQAMGCGGWVVLFDEGESMAQVRAPSRYRAWRFLEAMLDASPALIPVFAFTDALLARLDQDGEEPLRKRLQLHTLGQLDRQAWSGLTLRLTALHGRAYAWGPGDAVSESLLRTLDRSAGRGTRLTLKALVHSLDIEEQARC